MLFCSIEFIFFFLPVFLLIYYLVPQRYSNLVLFLGSIFFYWYGEHRYFILILVSLAVHFILTAVSEGKSRGVQRLCLILMLAYGFGSLFVFKYLGFFQTNWNHLAAYLAAQKGWQLPALNLTVPDLPIGISFYTFQIAAYAVDVYRGRVKREKSFIRLGAFLCMFPQLIAGPIVLYGQVADRLKKRKLSWDRIEDGLKLFIIGLSLKMLLANTFGILWNQAQTWGISSLSVPVIWMAVFAYTFQIYFDFQGYSLMAMGLGEMLGFKIPRNFRHPYTAISVTDFWRRWHITLSGWFRDYVYIPLGGSRKGLPRTILNMFIVWAFTGLWHGASWNFVLWGLYYFVLLVIERLFLGKILQHLPGLRWAYTFIAVSTGWVIFAVTDLSVLRSFLSGMYLSLGNMEAWRMGNGVLTDLIRQYGIFFLFGILFAMPFPYALYKKYKKNIITVLVLLGLFLYSVYRMQTAASNPFLYFRF